MSAKAKRPLSRQIQARAMRMLNVFMRSILRLPFSTPLTKRLMLVAFTGRKTCKVYQQPLSYVQQGETLLTPSGGKVNPTVRAFVGISKGPNGRLDRGRLEAAINYGFRIVRWHLGEEPKI